MGGSTDNEFCKLAWRCDDKDLNKLPQWSFADTGGVFARALGVLRSSGQCLALRATLIPLIPSNVVQHITVNGLNVGRSPQKTPCAYSTACKPTNCARVTVPLAVRS